MRCREQSLRIAMIYSITKGAGERAAETLGSKHHRTTPLLEFAALCVTAKWTALLPVRVNSSLWESKQQTLSQADQDVPKADISIGMKGSQ
jgi:hypothetical protein